MTHTLRPIVAALAATLALSTPALAQRETEQVDRTIPFGPGGTLRLKNFSGEIHITGGDESQATVHAVRRAPRARLDRIKLSIEASASEIVINANDRDDDEDDRDNVVETTFEIRVPRQTNIDVTSFSSGVTVEDVDGEHRAKTFSGDVRLVNVSGPIRAKTFSGDIDLQMPAADAASVSFRTFSGDLRSDIPLAFVSRTRRRFEATLNGGGRALTMETFSGDVRLTR